MTQLNQHDLPGLDIEVEHKIDGLLVDQAKADRTQKVQSSGRRSAFQSHQARAWTQGGNVD